MKKREFKQLLKQIKNNSFTENKLEIISGSYEFNEEIHNNRIGDEGAILLSQALVKNSHIKIVKLIFQNIK